MMRWKLTIEYDGSGFSGWQRQDHAMTVQQALEDAIKGFAGENVRVQGAGRTDAGVHALAQVAHFDLTKDADADTVRDAINFHARPHKVVVVQAEQVHDDFHARFDAMARSYRYQIYNRRAPSVLMAAQAWHLPRPLDIEAMQQAARQLIGNHDFSTFRAQNCQASTPVKTLDMLEIGRTGDMVTISTRARSFLYHQVRNMAGTLALVGTGQWSQKDFTQAFKAHDRTKGGPTAPAHGLFFAGVSYG
ncbi:MAG: tRNA pseudouridine(38-40) synthase TruA [Alphaproteobacteria bacterium]|nr:tRNA pseudouridine(38-40) synthase TruA [Alphaproteobacteria bacterium]